MRWNARPALSSLVLRRPVRRPGAALLLACAVPFVLTALPVGYVVRGALAAGPDGVLADLIRPYTLNLLVNTLVLSGSVTVLASLIAVAAAWCTECSDLPGRRWWRPATALPLAMPAYVSSFAWSSLGPEFQRMGGAIFILTLYAMPLVYLPVCAALRNLDPALEDVARSLGHRRWRCFRRVTLPQIMPAIGGGALLVAAHMLAEFGALSFLQVETFTTAIYDQYTAEFNNDAASLLSGVLVLVSLPVVLGEAMLRGRRVARLPRGNARRAAPVRLGWWSLLVIPGFALLTLLGFGVPLITLGFWLWQGASTGTGLGDVGSALLQSLGYALPGAILTTAVALPVVLVTLRHRGWLASLLDRLPYAVHALPGIVVALAAVSISLSLLPAIYHTTLLVMLVYIALFLPLAQSAIRAAAALVPPELENVARSLGKPPLRAFLLATLPNLAPGLAAALALVALQLMRELTAILLLAPAGVTTLATEFWSYTSDRAYGAAAPFAAALVLASGVPTYIFTARSLDPSRRR